MFDNYYACRYFAFELCAANLQDWAIAGTKRYTGRIPAALVGLHQMSLGLAHVHQQKHVHRDICPSNILISVGGDRLIISDFGLCKRVHESGGYSVTQHHGQRRWFAPERIKNEQDPNYRVTIDSDTWAMGCAFYFFVTKGSHPFEDDNFFDMQRNFIEGKFNLNGRPSVLKSLLSSRVIISNISGSSSRNAPQPCSYFYYPQHDS